MATEFAMPKLGLTMEEGTIREWLVADGEQVRAGDALLIIETDKTETEVTSPTAGRLRHTGDVGETFVCGARIGWLLAEGEADPAPAAPAQASANAAPVAVAAPVTNTPASRNGDHNGRVFASPNARRVAAVLHVDLAAVTGSGPGGRIVSEDVEIHASHAATAAPAAPSAPLPSPAATRAATTATFAARRLADMLGLDIDEIPSRSADGWVSRDDVAAHAREQLAAARGRPAAAAPAGSLLAATPLSQAPTRVQPLTGMRGTIARRMHAALAEMAQLTLTMDVDMDAVVRDRDERGGTGRPPGYTDYVVAATARALRRHPIANSQVTLDGVAQLPDVHVGLAVALDDGLVVPVIRHADRLALDELAIETAELAAVARAGKLSMAQMEGGTISVTALGMFGVDIFTPVINPPNTAIVGVGRLRTDVAWNPAGQPTPVRRLTLSLTWDHRAFDGAPAAAFAQTIKAYLEDPTTL